MNGYTFTNFILQTEKRISNLAKRGAFFAPINLRTQGKKQILVKVLARCPKEVFKRKFFHQAALVLTQRHMLHLDWFSKCLYELFNRFKLRRKPFKDLDVDDDIAHCPVGAFGCNVKVTTQYF